MKRVMIMIQPAPTQTRHPWRAVIRTIVAALPLVPIVIAELGVGSVPWVAAALIVIGSVTRILAIPAVNAWLTEYVPWLAATPRQP